jgi:hypothetical protein
MAAARRAWLTCRKREHHMSIKKKVLAVAATMTMVGGVSVVGLLPAAANTPSCGDDCYTYYGPDFGQAFVLDVLRQGEKVGQPIIQFRDSGSDPAEDFVYDEEGTVGDFYAAGLVSESLAFHYGGLGCESGYAPGPPATCTTPYPDYNAFELEYAPYGVDSGLCAGTGSTAGNGTPVALEPCGVSSKTVWVEDTGDGYDGYIPLINGSDTNFSHPYVLHYPGNGYPTDMPRPQLTTYTLQQYSDGIVFDNELWDEFEYCYGC